MINEILEQLDAVAKVEAPPGAVWSADHVYACRRSNGDGGTGVSVVWRLELRIAIRRPSGRCPHLLDYRPDVVFVVYLRLDASPAFSADPPFPGSAIVYNDGFDQLPTLAHPSSMRNVMPKQKTHKGTKKRFRSDGQRQGQASPEPARAIWPRG